MYPPRCHPQWSGYRTARWQMRRMKALWETPTIRVQKHSLKARVPFQTVMHKSSLDGFHHSSEPPPLRLEDGELGVSSLC